MNSSRFGALIIAATASHAVSAHSGGSLSHPLDWRTDQIAQVVTASSRKVSVEGRDCLVGTSLDFKVRDEYAFDIDEPVWLDLEFRLDDSNSKIAVTFNSNVEAGAQTIELKRRQPSTQTAEQWSRQTVILQRARFAHLGTEGTDFSINLADSSAKPPRPFTLCAVSLRRSYQTPVGTPTGEVAIEVADESGRLTPARIGLYDSTGRLPLPSDEAVVLKNEVVGLTRVAYVGSPWPVANRSVFYTDGRYHARLPMGDYELIVARGPEYRFVRRRFSVRADRTTSIKVGLTRWIDMAAKGWYSGDDHIHYGRADKHDDYIFQLFTRGEDLNVANALQMDDAVAVYFQQYDWRTIRLDPTSPFVLVPGQEAPRTSLLGHTTQLNIKKFIRDPDHYLLYQHTFEETHAQGGLAGFAHVIARPQWDGCYQPRAMAIEVPFGLVDFAEVFTNTEGDQSMWFDYLNLGFKIPPTAGTDWPYGSVPGSSRNYIKIEGSFAPQAWFDGLKTGRTFITTGPMLEFRINGQDIGSEIRVKKGSLLTVEARASINPDLGTLSDLELIEQGSAVKTVSSKVGAPSFALHEVLPAEHGTWFVLRASGKGDGVLALSAPIYVSVDGQGSWKPSLVPSIVAKLKSQMNEALRANPVEQGCTEDWITQPTFAKYWNAQRDALRQRIDQATAIYDDMVSRASSPTERQK